MNMIQTLRFSAAKLNIAPQNFNSPSGVAYVKERDRFLNTLTTAPTALAIKGAKSSVEVSAGFSETTPLGDVFYLKIKGPGKVSQEQKVCFTPTIPGVNPPESADFGTAIGHLIHTLNSAPFRQ